MHSTLLEKVLPQGGELAVARGMPRSPQGASTANRHATAARAGSTQQATSWPVPTLVHIADDKAQAGGQNQLVFASQVGPLLLHALNRLRSGAGQQERRAALALPVSSAHTKLRLAAQRPWSSGGCCQPLCRSCRASLLELRGCLRGPWRRLLAALHLPAAGAPRRPAAAGRRRCCIGRCPAPGGGRPRGAGSWAARGRALTEGGRLHRPSAAGLAS